MNIINCDLTTLQMILYPYPHLSYDNFLDIEFANKLQTEILNIDINEWDRYDNPFEQKYTLRNKNNFPPLLKELFNKLESDNFISELSKLTGHDLKLDTTRNFWGVHYYNNGDKLDIHVDAGLHPTTHQKKQITFGIYLSVNWKEEYGCGLELWEGDNASIIDAKIYKKNKSIEPKFNRMIMFECNDYSWHGNPEPVCAPQESKRIFITLSYLSENFNYDNKRVKAFFIKRPDDPVDDEKDKLRFLRADPKKYKDIYRI
jgi:Rps23 Pro-64 3,4-dihydroxylase Tpa1-like proline 4-hydroxylase